MSLSLVSLQNCEAFLKKGLENKPILGNTDEFTFQHVEEFKVKGMLDGHYNNL